MVKWSAMALSSTFLAMTFFISLSVFADDRQNSATASQDISQTAGTLDFANGLYARKMYSPAVSEYEKFIQTHPVSPDMASARFRLADSYYFLKDYDKAIGQFRIFIKDFPDDPRAEVAWFRVATVKFYQKDLKTATRLFFGLSSQAKDPTIRTGTLFYLAKINEQHGNTDRMTELYEKILSNEPQNEYVSYAALGLGEAMLKQGKTGEALAAFKRAADSKDPVEISYEAGFRMAQVYFDNKDMKQAHSRYLALFNELNQHSNMTQTGQRTGELLEKSLLGIFYCDYYLKNTQEALAHYQENQAMIRKGGHNGEILFLLSDLLEEQKDYGRALSFLDQILSDPSQDQELVVKTLFKKTKILRLTNKNDQALAQIQKVIDSRAGDQPRAYYERGEILNTLGKYPEALTAYEQTLEVPGAKDYAKKALFQLAVTQLKSGDKKSARQTFLKYIQDYPGEADAEKACLEAVQIDLDDQNFDRAAKNAATFVAAYPNSPILDIGLYKLGMAMTGLKNYKAAADAFIKIRPGASAAPFYPEALYGAAVSLDRTQDIKRAIPLYEKFTADYPQHALFRQAMSRLGALYLLDEDFDKAGGFYQDILLNKKDFDVEPKMALWLVHMLLNKGDYASLMKVLDVLPQRYPQEPLDHEINFFRAEAFMGLGQFKDAIMRYQKAIGAKPDGPYVPHSYLGIGIASVALNDLAGAETNFTQALKYDYEVEVALRARFEIASLRLRTGNMLEAAKAFMMVPILYDDEKYCPIALYKAGECFMKVNKPDEAKNAFQELKNRYPDSEWAKKIPTETTAAPATATTQ